MQEFTVTITETTIRRVVVFAETPDEAERIAEENYLYSEVDKVKFEAQTTDNFRKKRG